MLFCFVLAAVIDGHNMEVDFPQVLHEYQQLEPQRERVVLVPRSNILNTMVEEFKDPRILHDIVTFALIADNEIPEIGWGAGWGAGVTREILSLFWREFFISLAIGAAEKVPSVRHDYQKNHWLSIARVFGVWLSASKVFSNFPVESFCH